MATAAVIYHPTITHYLKFVATTQGRDKILRTLQYFSRFYAWYLLRTNASPKEIAPFEAIKKQFGLARKLMRVGKNVEHFKAAALASDQRGGDPVLKYLAVGRQLGYAGYLSLDAVTYLDAAGIRPSPAAKRLSREASRCWFAGLLCSAISGTYALYQLSSKNSRISKADVEGVVEKKKIEKESAAIKLQLICDLCDMTSPSTALGYANFDDGFVGLAGTVSSLIGVYNTWKKTA